MDWEITSIDDNVEIGGMVEFIQDLYKGKKVANMGDRATIIQVQDKKAKSYYGHATLRLKRTNKSILSIPLYAVKVIKNEK